MTLFRRVPRRAWLITLGLIGAAIALLVVSAVALDMSLLDVAVVTTLLTVLGIVWAIILSVSLEAQVADVAANLCQIAQDSRSMREDLRRLANALAPGEAEITVLLVDIGGEQAGEEAA